MGGGFGNGILNLGPEGIGFVLAVSGVRDGALNAMTGRFPNVGKAGLGVVSLRDGGRNVGDLLSAVSGVLTLVCGLVVTTRTDVVGGTSNKEDLVGSGLSVGRTNVRTTVVVIELKISVVVVTVVVASAGSCDVVLLSTVSVDSGKVPRMVRLPMIVETKVLGAIVVVKTDVIVSGLSRV